MLSEFFSWWGQQLLDVLPGRRNDGQALPDATVLDVADDASVRVLERRKGKEAERGRFPLDEDDRLRRLRSALPGKRRGLVVLRIAGAALLEREVVLPLAAERDPERVLHFEMDRLTPFSAEEVYWAWRTIRPDRALGRLHLLLSTVPRTAVAPLLALLGRAGIVPLALEAKGGDGAWRSVPLTHDGRRQAVRRRATAIGLAVCAVLAIAAAVVPFAMQARARAAVENRIRTLRPRADEAEALRRTIARAQAGAGILAAERARLGDVITVLATLTRLLPDDTYLTDLALAQRKLTINGQSFSAARLISILSADPGIRNPSFAAPVTRAADGKADLFSIRADLAP